MYIYGIKEKKVLRSHRSEETRRAPRARIFDGVVGREGEHANKLALYLKQLLGIAVTHTDEDQGPYCRAETKRLRVRHTRSRKLVEAAAAAARRTGGERRRTPRKEIKESLDVRGISNFQLVAHAGGRAAGAGPVSGQSVDKRIVRTVLNRSEYLYAGSYLRTFFAPLSLWSSSSSPRVSTFGLRQRYLLDYPVLINSSGFIFIFTT